MITTESGSTAYSTRITSGLHQTTADTVKEFGGGGAGFRPHEFLEAALASCLNIWIRMKATEHGIELSGVSTTVKLSKDNPSEANFEYAIRLEGPVTKAQEDLLLSAADVCPVRQTLGRKLCFRAKPRDEPPITISP